MANARAALLTIFTLFSSSALPAASCPDGSEYAVALCRYSSGDFAAAEALFGTIAEKAALEPETIKAEYFLARSRMRLGRNEEAAGGFMKIHRLDRSFYDEWNCDFLLGQAREAVAR